MNNGQRKFRGGLTRRPTGPPSLLVQKKRKLQQNVLRRRQGLPSVPLPPHLLNLAYVRFRPPPIGTTLGAPGRGRFVQRGRQRRPFIGPLRQPKQQSRQQRKDVAVKKIEQVAGPSAKVDTPVEPAQVLLNLDINLFYMVSECLVSHYSMTTDLMEDVSPLYFSMYFMYTAFLYLVKKGLMVGAPSSFGVGSEKSNLAVPYALAKLLEYCAPYDNQLGASLRYTFTDPFPGVLDYQNQGIGALSPAYPRPDSFPKWQFWPAEMNIISGATAVPNTYRFVANGETLVNISFLAFIASGIVDQISGDVQRRGNTVKLKDVGVKAPDSSMYARPLNPPDDQTNIKGGIGGLDSNYDPELAIMFCPTLYESQSYNSSYDTAYPVPIQNRSIPPAAVNAPELNFADFFQLACTWVFLCQQTTNEYRPGKIRDVFTLEGSKLRTLYTQGQPIDGRSLSDIVTQLNNQLLANKSANSGNDEANANLCVLASTAFNCLQRKINLSEVMHINCPTTYKAGNTYYFQPQFMFCDSAWDTVDLPVLIAAHVSSIGIVINEGVLRVPVNDYSALPSQESITNSVIGPMNWSAYGWTTGEDSYYPVNNAMTTGWGSIDTPTAQPNLPLDTTTNPPTPCNIDFVTSYYGIQPGNYDGGTFDYLYPAFYNANFTSAMLQLYQSWIATNNYGEVIPTAPANPTVFGQESVMNMATNVEPGGQTKVSMQPNYTDVTTPAPVSTTSYEQVLISSAPGNASWPKPLSRASAALAGIMFNGDRANANTNTTLVRSYWKKNKLSKITGSTAPEILDTQPAIGRFTMDYPWSGGLQGVLSGIVKATTATSSPLSNKLERYRSRPDYDIVKFIETEMSSVLEGSLKNINKKGMKLSQYAQGRTTPKKKSFFSKVISTTGDIVKGTGEVVKLGKMAAEAFA